MSKMLESQQSYKKDYYNCPVNKWLRDYLEQVNTKGYGHKGDSDKAFAIKCNIKYSKIRTITGGSSPVTVEELIKISKATNVTTDEILFGKDIPNELKIDNIEILSKESYNILYKHMTQDKLADKIILRLFPGPDTFISFLDYLIKQEDFLLAIFNKCNVIVEEFKLNENVRKTAYNKGYDDFLNIIKENKELDKELSNIITNSKIRGAVKDLAKKYIYDRIWGRIH